MCVVERKTYLHSDGGRETIETTRRCHRAVGSRLCPHVEHKTVDQMRIVERRPASSREPSDPVIVTQGRDGRERVYRDVTSRPNRRSSIRRSNTNSNRSSVETPPSASSATYVEIMPEAPSPPLHATRTAIPRRVTITEDPVTTLRSDGTAVYSHPPPMDLPRAMDNERRGTRPPSRRSSISSLTAEVDEPEPILPRRRHRRPSISINTSGRPSTASSSSMSSPGLSQLPPLGDLRRDSARGLPKHHPRSDLRESAARQRDEDERQAQLERDRLAESDRRQEARRNAEYNASSATRHPGESSRERHIQATAAALEGRARADSRRASMEAELQQLAREREAADLRKRESDQSSRYADDQLRRHAEASTRYYETRPSPRTLRRTTAEIFPPHTTSPLSARTPVLPVAVHHYPPTTRRNSTIRERGEDVIAREQAREEASTDRTRRASQRLTDVLGDMTLDDGVAVDDEGYEVMEYYSGSGIRRRESRRARRDAEREARRRDFFR